MAKQNSKETALQNTSKVGAAVQKSQPAEIDTVPRYYTGVLNNFTIHDYIKDNIDDGTYQGERLAMFHIGNAMEHVCQLVGVKPANRPEGGDAEIIAAFIISAYSYLIPDEIYKAFAYAIQGKFNISKDALEHYQNVDCKYLAGILNPYVKFAHHQKEIAVKNKIESERDRLGELKVVAKKDNLAVKGLIREAYEKHRTDKYENILRADWYDWLTSSGLMLKPPLGEFATRFMNQCYAETRVITSARHITDKVKIQYIIAWFVDLEVTETWEKKFQDMDTCIYLSKATREMLIALELKESDLALELDV